MTTGIEWTDETWNPVRGCSRVSEGCRHCYAERFASRQWSGAYRGLVRRSGGEWRWTGEVRLVDELLHRPRRWRKPRRIFVNSMSDLFHEAVPDSFIDRVFAVMAFCPQHMFQILTKRPERMLAYMQRSAGLEKQAAMTALFGYPHLWSAFGPPYPLKLFNVWLGVSCEDQATADERIPVLLRTPAAGRFVSCEPLLGPIDLHHVGPYDWNVLDDGWGVVDWVIVGGESGPGARPMDPAWARALRDQCATAGVPFFMKQMWGSTKRTMPPVPDDLTIRQWPTMLEVPPP